MRSCCTSSKMAFSFEIIQLFKISTENFSQGHAGFVQVLEMFHCSYIFLQGEPRW